MPNISGIITNGKTLENPNEITSKYRSVHSLGGLSFTHRVFKAQTCVICNTLTGILRTTIDQPVSDSKNNTFLFLEGEIYNTDELLAYLNTPRELSQCNILLALFMKQGPEFVSLLNGEFNIVIYQKAENQLIILNDHLASKPIYYMEQGGALLFGSEKKSILAINDNFPVLDPLGILQVFAFNQNLNGRTFIKGIKRLPSASRLTYKDGRVTLRRSYPLKFRTPESLPKIGSLVEEWCDHLKQAMMRRLKNKSRILINLSGGLDSRALALAIDKNCRPIFARTKGSIKSREVLYATKIARRLGFDHYIETPGMAPLSFLLAKIVWRTECAVNFVNCLSLTNHARIKKNADFIIGGAYGNTSTGSAISADMFLSLSRDRFINRTYRKILQHSLLFLSEVFNNEFLQKFLPVLRDSYFNSFERLDDKTNIMLYENWSIFEKQPQRTLSSAPVDSHLFEHIRPFIDKDHMKFAMSLPTWLRYGPVLYHAMIYRLGPQLSDIPYANTNLRLRKTVFGNAINKSMTLGLKGYARIFGSSSLPFKYKYVPADQVGFANYIRRDPEFQRIIEEFISSASFDSSIFNRQGIMKMLDKHYQGFSNYTFPLCLLATFAVGIPYFITHRPISCPQEAEPVL